MLGNESDLVFKQECYEIDGACFEVYKGMGSGFLEAVYQECLGIEFQRRGIPFAPTPELRRSYGGILLSQKYLPDYLCYERIIVELKAVTALANEHLAQAINYLRATNLQLAILVNFGHHPKLEYERFVLTRRTDSEE